jgi:hypothetical protein
MPLRVGRSLPAKAAWVALVLLVAVLLAPPPAMAQEIRGRITGRVTDQATGVAQGGVTVIVQGQQGEDATLTDDKGFYTFPEMPVGTYVLRFYSANTAIKVERGDVTVSAGATVRADAAIPSQATVEETYVIRKRAPAIDVGSARQGMTVGEDYLNKVPLERTFGDVTEKAPGAFAEASGGVSIAGATGLENVYVLDGLNVTGMENGDIMNRRYDLGGGSNLTLDFIKELQVNTGGYRAEFGGAMGGVINVVTKSGSNEFHGTVFSYWSPYWLSGDPAQVRRRGVALVGLEKPDYDTNVGFEVGGPILKNKLFFWAGFAPRLEKTHFFRDIEAFVDADNNQVADIDPKTGEEARLRVDPRYRTNQLRQSYQMGGKIDFLPAPNHRLTLGAFSTPSRSKHVRNLAGLEAVNDPLWAQQQVNKTNTDVILNYVGNPIDDRWRIEANLGWHREVLSDRSPFSELDRINQIEWNGSSLYAIEGVPGCAPTADGFDPCPVDVYRTGGYGLARMYTGNRLMGELKSTNRLGPHELKYGLREELNYFNQNRFYSGPEGNRALIQNFPNDGYNVVWSFFTLPQGRYPGEFSDQLDVLAGPGFYQDNLVAKVKSFNTAYFVQDTYRVLPNLVVDAGFRLENQRVYDFRGNQFLNLYNPAPRLGVVYDPTNEGRSKIYTHFGQFYETIPMNLAARYFGGEGILLRAYDISSCTPPINEWKGTGGEWNGCTGSFGNFTANNGGAYPVQTHIKGQYHNEIVAGFRHSLTDDLVVGLDYTHRWLGRIIEDGTADYPNLIFALGNPGNVPDAAHEDVQKDIDAKQAQVDADPASTLLQAQLADLKTKQKNLKYLDSVPKPKRTYDALTVSASKRLGQHWAFQGQYTYSRLIGNYNGLYDSDASYFAPNGGTANDTADLVLNKNGPLANDRPHSGRVDSYYQAAVSSKGTVLAGLSFSAYSGIPRNHVVALFGGQQLVFLLPRGSAGRTPTVTQVDLKFMYRHQLPKMMAIEAFLDIFNVFNERTALRMDDDYSRDVVAPIVNGTPEDLKYAKNVGGSPINKNPNFGNGFLFQAPIHGRLGVRFLF